MRDTNFTRSGNGRRHKSGARLLRVIERANKDGWAKRLKRDMDQYARWEKSFQNVKAYDKNGNMYWAMARKQLLHKGGKP
jgi:hypothetical protein